VEEEEILAAPFAKRAEMGGWTGKEIALILLPIL